jgi:hypothetical protein
MVCHVACMLAAEDGWMGDEKQILLLSMENDL